MSAHVAQLLLSLILLVAVIAYVGRKPHDADRDGAAPWGPQ